ncbi:MAG: serine hydrolase [bacterium]|nr:serine hydrolase [bacterium]
MKPGCGQQARSLLLVGLTMALGCAQAHGDGATRVERIENGLLPPILLKGAEPERMSLRERMEHYQVPGLSIAVIEDFEIVWTQGYGVVRAGSDDPVTPETLFQAGSISKPVTALLALRQVSAGRLALDDPVNDVLTSWQLPDSESGGPEPVRVRHLLTHSAGLAPFSFPSVVGEEIPRLVDLLNGRGTPGVARIEPPGRYAYSNPAYGVLQQLLVDATGRPFEELARKQLFEPLGMSHSSFGPILPPRLFALAAYGHSKEGEPIDGKGWAIVPGSVGGLWSTPTDLCRFLRGVFQASRGEATAVLPRELAARMVTRQVEDASLGAALEGEGKAARILHGGGLPGFVAFVVGYPATGRGAAVMVSSSRGWRLMQELLRSVAVEYGWPDYVHEREVVAMSPETFARYAGQYEFERPRGMKMKIYAKDGRFYRGTYEMLPVSETLFVIPRAGDELEFVTDSTGRATSFLYGQPGTQKTRARRIE